MDNKTLLVLGGLAVAAGAVYLHSRNTGGPPAAMVAAAPVSASKPKKRSRWSVLKGVGRAALSAAAKTPYGMAVQRSVAGAVRGA